ncbi:MAG: carbohydrate ABC transporter permease [Spirochaetales bacterium]|nr:carbohydrate ABC transporter permease [Spirochaetales bacterium]
MNKKKRIVVNIILIIACLIIAFPILFAFIKATQTPGQVMSPRILPSGYLFENIKFVWTRYNLWGYMLNSFKISLSIMLGKTFLSFFAAFALVFLDFKAKKPVFIFILITLMMPTEMLIVGLFDIISLPSPTSFKDFFSWFIHPSNIFLSPVKFGFGWTDNLLSVIVPFFASATGVFLFRQHFRNIPTSLIDASIIDGAGSFRFIYYVLLPLSRNTIGALFVVQFIYAWNQYLWPRIIIRNSSAQVIQVGLKAIIGNAEGVEWGQVMAGTIISMIPPLIMLFLFQDQFMKGIAVSDDK